MPGPTHPDAAQRSVLVIDDEETSQEIARMLLEQMGFGDIVVVGDGAAALRILDRRARPPDFVLCDIFMPDADGIEMVTALAARQFKGGLVLVTGGDTQYLVIAKRIARFHGLKLLASLNKPLRAQTLSDALFGPAVDERS
ncbi:MAG: response regulator [Rhodoferax sp.]|nr:response regulator [Rhodoferax sp.]